MADLEALAKAMNAARSGGPLPDDLFADTTPVDRFPQPDVPKAPPDSALTPRQRLAARAATPPAPEAPDAAEMDVQPVDVDDQAAFEARLARLGQDD